MRLWLINPAKMCRKHLLGEHVECHMMRGSILKGKNISGSLKDGLIELGKIKQRHDELVAEMQKRGYNHKTPMDAFQEGTGGFVDIDKNISDICCRCAECRKLILGVEA